MKTKRKKGDTQRDRCDTTRTRKQKRRGRKSLLGAKLQREIVSLLSEGNAVRTVCEFCGVGESTFHQWVSRGENGEAPFAEFAEKVNRARAGAARKLVGVITNASKLDWRAAAFLLERGWVSLYGKSSRDSAPAGNEQTLRVNYFLETSKPGHDKTPASFEEVRQHFCSDFPHVKQVEKAQPEHDDDD